jgi:DNA-binding winged helix-turn-helix (wHTH) protein/tetratricopeptide (TPR) repeat protein/archaellum biogenesis ATPase FlaH
MQAKIFQLGDWLVDSETCTLTHDAAPKAVPVEPRAMDVLVALCRQAGDVVSADELLRLCWDGVIVGENQVHKAIAQLRRILGDRAGSARYIENIRKRGYRTVAPVKALPGVRAGVRASAGADSWSDGSPFVGLDPFSETHSAVFFGRDEATARLRDAVIAQVYAGRALVLVFGPSGSGKTSLVQAGLLPALRRSDQGFQLVATTTLDLGDIGEMPLMTALGSALLDLEVNGNALMAGHSAEGIGAALTTAEPASLQAALRRAAPDRPNARVVVFIDRLEALFNAPTFGHQHKNQFLLALDSLAASGAVIVIAACRNDFYPDVAREPVLMKGKAAGAHFDVGPPTRAEIAQMIRRPALVAKLSFGVDPDTQAQLDDILCDGTADNPDALPLLQYTLHELYLQRSNNRELTVAAYRALGGIGGALNKRAEATLNSLPEPSRASLARILSMIVTVNDESVRNRRIPWSALANDHERTLVRTFVEQRLFVSLVYDGESVFGIAHEAMLRQWPRVVAWIAEHRQALRTRARLEVSARRWVEEGRSADLLLPRGKLLEEARELLGPMQIPLNTEVTALIAASVQKVKHADQRRIGALIGFALIAIAAAALGMRAHKAGIVADQRRHEAEDLMDFMVGDLADKLRPLGRLDLLAGIGGKALGYFGDVQPTDLPPASREQQARALQTIGEVARSRADPNGARRALLLAKTLLDTNLTQGYESANLLKDLGADAFWLGQISLDQGRLDEAESWFRQYQDYSDRMMAREPDNVDAWVEVSYADNSLGSVAQARGDNRAAAAAFERSIALKRRALVRRPDDHVLRAELADSLSWLGSAHQAQGELRPAIVLFEQEQAELTALRAAAPTELNWTYRLIIAVQRHAILLVATGNDAAAATELRSAVALAQGLTQHDPTNRLWQRQLLSLQVLTAETQANLGELREALELQTATATGLASLTRLDPANQAWMLLESANLLNLGESLLLLGRPQEASERFQSALDRMREAGGHARGETEIEQKQARGLVGLAQARVALGERAAALEACRQAITILQPLVHSDAHDYNTQDLWVRSHLCVDEGDQVAAAHQWLAQIGYRQAGYIRLLSQLH